MSLFDHLGELAILAKVADAIHSADAQLHTARKGETITISIPGTAGLRLTTKSGRHLHFSGVSVVMDDDPRPPHAGPPPPAPALPGTPKPAGG